MSERIERYPGIVVVAHRWLPLARRYGGRPYDAPIASDRSSLARSVARIALGGALIFAGIGHLTFARTDFQAQVPDWTALDKDLVVILSGIVEIVLGGALIVVRKRRALLGLAAGLFFIAVFPGNISQFVDGDDAFGLSSNSARRNRLFFQPVLVAWAWWSTDAFSLHRGPRRSQRLPATSKNTATRP